MTRTMMKSKIHRATVTEANIEYEGSVTIDRDLLDAADMLPYEQVDIWDCTNGNRLIIASWTTVPDSEARTWKAKRVFVDGQNVARD